jgi:NADH dehydrogenase FAD-containing subunit
MVPKVLGSFAEDLSKRAKERLERLGVEVRLGQGVETGKFRLKGFVAWLAWAGVHVVSLAPVGLRLSVVLQWMWTFLTGQRGSRLA